jgi:hypothetical protein
VFKPGFLTAEYLAGRRVRYARPLQLFVIINVVFFFSLQWMGWFGWTYRFYTSPPFPQAAARIQHAEARMAETKVPPTEFQIKFDAILSSKRKAFIGVMIPLFAFASLLLHLRRRRNYVAHLVFALHYYSFMLVLLIAGFMPLVFLARGIAVLTEGVLGGEEPLLIAQTLVFVAYLYAALRRVFQQGRLLTGFKAVVLSLTTHALLFLVWQPLMFYVGVALVS